MPWSVQRRAKARAIAITLSFVLGYGAERSEWGNDWGNNLQISQKAPGFAAGRAASQDHSWLPARRMPRNGKAMGREDRRVAMLLLEAVDCHKGRPYQGRARYQYEKRYCS